MARKLEDQVNVIAPDADYPYGRIRDDDGTGNGTPLTEAVHGDYHQWFARVLAQSGVVANNLPDNETNGFQYFEALLQIISKRIGRYSVDDDVDGTISTDFNDYILPGIFSVNASFTNGPSGIGGTTQLVITTNDIDEVFQKVIDLLTGAIWVRVFSGSWGGWFLVRLAEKRIDIGDWDMDTNATKAVAHGLSNYKRIRTVFVLIRDDADTDYRNLLINNIIAAGANNGGSINLIDATNINLARIGSGDGGFFDGTDYNATSFNRGFVTITYDPAP